LLLVSGVAVRTFLSIRNIQIVVHKRVRQGFHGHRSDHLNQSREDTFAYACSFLIADSGDLVRGFKNSLFTTCLISYSRPMYASSRFFEEMSCVCYANSLAASM
jgi:hypothetical protein